MKSSQSRAKTIRPTDQGRSLRLGESVSDSEDRRRLEDGVRFIHFRSWLKHQSGYCSVLQIVSGGKHTKMYVLGLIIYMVTVLVWYSSSNICYISVPFFRCVKSWFVCFKLNMFFTSRCHRVHCVEQGCKYIIIKTVQTVWLHWGPSRPSNKMLGGEWALASDSDRHIGNAPVIKVPYFSFSLVKLSQ